MCCTVIQTNQSAKQQIIANYAKSSKGELFLNYGINSNLLKDPNAPKRPLTAYFMWLKENREKIKQSNPGFNLILTSTIMLNSLGMSVIEISKAAGVQWNALKDKTRWEKMAADDKVRYEREMAKYQGR